MENQDAVDDNNNDADQTIADTVLSCLDDNITVEVGMGRTPDAIMRTLSC